MRRTLDLLSAAGCLLVSACGSSDPGLTAGRSDAASGATTATSDGSRTSTPDTISNDTTPDTTGDTEVPIPDPDGTTPPPSSVVDNPADALIDFGANKTKQPYDDFLQASLADVQDYWRETYPQVTVHRSRSCRAASGPATPTAPSRCRTDAPAIRRSSTPPRETRSTARPATTSLTTTSTWSRR